MWRVYGRKVVARWCGRNSKKRGEKKESAAGRSLQYPPSLYNAVPSQLGISPDHDQGRSHQDGENAKEKKHTCHGRGGIGCDHHHSSLLETLGWLGAAFAVGFNLQHRYCLDYSYQPENVHPETSRQCAVGKFCSSMAFMLARMAFAMPLYGGRKAVLPEHPNFAETPLPQPQHEATKATGSSDYKEEAKLPSLQLAFQKMEAAVLEYSGHLENMRGLQAVAKDPALAFHCFTASAQLGCIKAHYNLAVCYETGQGTEVNLEKAAHHYKQAAKAGHGLACYNLGVFFLEGQGGLPQEDSMALKLIKRAAKHGVIQATAFMGVHYKDKGDWEKAVPFLKQAADDEDPEAQYCLAQCYENGWGVERNDSEAATLYSKAACGGYLDANCALGTFYEEGKGGMTHDPYFAMELYQKGADQGDEMAVKHLEQLQNKLERDSAAKATLKSLPSEQASLRTATDRLQPSLILHVSSSSPELSHGESENTHKPPKAFDISQYLGLILPSILPKFPKKSPAFWVGEGKEFGYSEYHEPQVPSWQVLPDVEVGTLKL